MAGPEKSDLDPVESNASMTIGRRKSAVVLTRYAPTRRLTRAACTRFFASKDGGGTERASTPPMCLAGGMDDTAHRVAGARNQASAVTWEGAVNAWRISGDVYRMGRREWLTETGWNQAYDDGIRTVIDLRNVGERQPRESDPVVSQDVMARIQVLLAPTEDPENVEFRSICRPYLNNPAVYLDNARLFPEKLAAVFKAVAAAPGGVVIHCSAGRDRSGMIAAMLQDLAGADDYAIVSGYQAAMRGINERHRIHGAPHVHEQYLDETALAPLLESRGERVLDFVRRLNTRQYLLQNRVTYGELSAILALLHGRVAV